MSDIATICASVLYGGLVVYVVTRFEVRVLLREISRARANADRAARVFSAIATLRRPHATGEEFFCAAGKDPARECTCGAGPANAAIEEAMR